MLRKSKELLAKTIYDNLTFSWRLQECTDGGCSKGCCPSIWEDVNEKDAIGEILNTIDDFYKTIIDTSLPVEDKELFPDTRFDNGYRFG